MKLKPILPILFLSLVILFNGVVSAEEENEDTREVPNRDTTERLRSGSGPRREDREENEKLREQQKEENEKLRETKKEEIKATNLEKRCEKVGELVTKRIEIFEKTKTNHAENYDKLSTRLADIVAKLTAKGFDTTKLTTDISTLNTMVSEYKAKYALFVTELKATQTLVCTAEAPVSYKEKLDQSKEMLQELRTMREEIRNFYLTVIREDIKVIRQQAEEKIETEGNE